MDCIPHVHVTEVQWSNGYDFCLTRVLSTEGSRFDPGLNHFFVFCNRMRLGPTLLVWHKYASILLISWQNNSQFLPSERLVSTAYAPTLVPSSPVVAPWLPFPLRLHHRSWMQLEQWPSSPSPSPLPAFRGVAPLRPQTRTTNSLLSLQNDKRGVCVKITL
jgi:hypothetical protein